MQALQDCTPSHRSSASGTRRQAGVCTGLWTHKGALADAPCAAPHAAPGLAGCACPSFASAPGQAPHTERSGYNIEPAPPPHADRVIAWAQARPRPCPGPRQARRPACGPGARRGAGAGAPAAPSSASGSLRTAGRGTSARCILPPARPRRTRGCSCGRGRHSRTSGCPGLRARARRPRAGQRVAILQRAAVSQRTRAFFFFCSPGKLEAQRAPQ